LAIYDLNVEQIVVMTIERIPVEIFVIPVAKSNGGPCQDVVDPATQARPLTLCGLQGILNGGHDSPHPLLVGFDIAVGRTHSKFGYADAAEEILAAGPQEQLEHGILVRGQRSQKITPLWLTKI
jgi:hypothetical protein